MYEVHQVGPKDNESQNFRFKALIGTELVPRQISATATALTDGKNLYLKLCYLVIKSPKK
jgi:hypothetical protein